MTVVFIILAILSFQLPVAFGLLGLAIAVDIFISAAGLQLSIPQSLNIGLLLFSLPCAAILAGMFFDSFVDHRRSSGVFSVLLPVLACSLMFGTGWWMDFAAAAITTGRDAPAGDQVLLFSSALSAVVFCAGVSAFVAMAIQLAVELPARWFEGALRARVSIAFDALRPLTVVTVLALALNLIVGLCAQELWPSTIATQMRKI